MFTCRVDKYPLQLCFLIHPTIAVIFSGCKSIHRKQKKRKASWSKCLPAMWPLVCGSEGGRLCWQPVSLSSWKSNVAIENPLQLVDWWILHFILDHDFNWPWNIQRLTTMFDLCWWFNMFWGCQPHMKNPQSKHQKIQTTAEGMGVWVSLLEMYMFSSLLYNIHHHRLRVSNDWFIVFKPYLGWGLGWVNTKHWCFQPHWIWGKQYAHLLKQITCASFGDSWKMCWPCMERTKDKMDTVQVVLEIHGVMFSWNQIAGYTKGMAAIASHQVADWMQMESSLGRPWPGPPLWGLVIWNDDQSPKLPNALPEMVGIKLSKPSEASKLYVFVILSMLVKTNFIIW